jgi:hypothetical protein
VEKGVRGVLESGYIAGYPLQDVRVIVYDGKSHPVDSKEVAFVSAGRKAFLDALGKARPIVLEPIVNVEIFAPETKMGDVAGELSGHRGQIKGSDTPRPGTVQITAQAPLSELEHFPARLKSLTAGHGSYSMEFSHYEPAPPQLQQKLAARTSRKPKRSSRMHFVRAGGAPRRSSSSTGFACRLEDWQAQLNHFQKSHMVVACDLRGHGETPGRPHECTIAHYGGDVAALVNHLELNGCILVGHSMGTRVVLEANRLLVSAHHPERVGGIVLIDGSRSGSGDPDAAEAAAHAIIEKVGYPAFAEHLFRQMFFKPSAEADAIVARALRQSAEFGRSSGLRWRAGTPP